MTAHAFTPPGWPDAVRIVMTTRGGGVSAPPFDSFNLAAHVGDSDVAVAENRRLLRGGLPPGCRPFWLTQVHGTRVVEASPEAGGVPEADASWTRSSGIACAILTADCLPVLLTDRQGTVVAAAHAGWRGLAAGVIEGTVEAFHPGPDAVLAWIGPAIGSDAFEVGSEVREVFLDAATATEHASVARCFRRGARPDRWLADLRALARVRLARAGVGEVEGDQRCTFSDAATFFSHRRDGPTGRMAFLIHRRDS